MKLNYLYVCLALVATLMVGCSTTQPPLAEPQVNLAGYPPPFRDGYLDGCNSARNPEKTVKDADRYKKDAMYASGWRDGFDICSEKKYD